MGVASACGGSPVLPKKLRKEDLDSLTETSRLKPTEVRALYARFRRLAPKGYLYPDQFRETLGVLGIVDDHFLPDQMFRVFDIDQDGKLSFHEFASSLAVMIRGSEDEKLKLSFDMAAGHRGAAVISFEEFERLIRACNTMMLSLLADAPPMGTVSEEDIRKMYFDLASDNSGDENVVMTVENYRAAAQTNGDFLACLGLASPRNMQKHPSLTTIHRENNRPGRDRAGSQVSVTTQQMQLDEVKQRLLRMRELVQHDDRCLTGPLPSSDEDPDERWWTPPPKRDIGSVRGRTRKPAVDSINSVSREFFAEFDRVLGCFGVDHQPTRLLLETTSLSGGNCSPRSISNHHHHPNASFLQGRGVTQRRAEARSEDDLRMDATMLEGNNRVHDSSGSDTSQSHRRGSNKHSANTGTASQQGRPRRRKQHRLLGPKKGLAVHFGHENWNMVLSMMIGIRMSVGRSRHEVSRELQPVDFIMKEKFSIIPRLANIFDSEVSKRVEMTRFIDYAPMVFQKIRASFGISHDEYLRSIGPEQLLGNMVLGNLASLSELSSEGKSGAFFYYTADGRYMMKTVSTKEHQLLKRMLKRYFDHTTRSPGTLIVRFLGLHCLSVRRSRKGRSRQDQKLYFVVMGNMFNAPCEIHRRYDLKGSWVGRMTPPHLYDPTTALKDVDFLEAQEKLRVGPETKEMLVRQIEQDTAFLRDNNIIDYSLLLGIHDVSSGGDPPADGWDQSQDLHGRPSQMDGIQRAASSMQNVADDTETPLSVVPFVISASAVYDSQLVQVPLHQRDNGGLLSNDKSSLYFIGIIDILTPYDSVKKVEHHVKSLRYRSGVSCCPPPFYADRFNNFMRDKVIV